MKKDSDTPALKIVEAVLQNLSGRRGIGDALDEIDEGVKLEIELSLVKTVKEVLR